MDTSTTPVSLLFPQYVRSLVHMHLQRCFSIIPDPRGSFFFFFFFLRLDGSAAEGFHEDRVNSVPKAVTLTNNPCSLELSSGHTKESMLLPPLLLERQDCRHVHQVSNHALR